jgi:isopenicillin-N epimerase
MSDYGRTQQMPVSGGLEAVLTGPVVTRRGFLAGLSAGVAATLGLMYQGRAFAEVPVVPGAVGRNAYLASEEAFFGEFAKALLLDPREKYFAVAQKGSQPLPILSRFKEGLDQIARDPFPVYLEPSEQTRAKIAKGYGARVDEIAISRNTTDAISQILNGIHWEQGDEILCSAMEYPTCVATVLHVAGRFGVTIRQFGVPMAQDATVDEVVESVRRQIAPGKTKVIYCSCITHPIGQRLPLRRIAALAQANGIITVVDGAHYSGQFVPRLDDIGIDFWGMSGHKWQCGPGGTGILYARNAAHPANPMPLPRFHLVRSGSLDAPTDGSRPEGFDIGAALSLYGFPESADWRALGEVCELWDHLGRGRIEAYILALADYIRDGIAGAFGEGALLQPVQDPELKSGIIAFNPFPAGGRRRDAELSKAFQDRLFQEYGYHVGMGGLGPRGLTRAPDPEAQAFCPSCVPNRDPLTGAPSPTDIPFRVDAPVWIRRRDCDDFVAACKELQGKLLA